MPASDSLAQSPADTNTAVESPEQLSQYPVDARLQMVWSAPRVRHWHIRFSVAESDHGHFSELTNFCDSDATTGAYEVAADGRSITFAPRRGLADGEFQVRFQGESVTRLQVEVLERSHRQVVGESANANENHSTTIDVASLIAGAHAGPPDGASAKWSLRRLPYDTIRVEFGNANRVVTSNQELDLTVRANGLMVAKSKRLSLHYELFRVQDGKSVAQQTHTLQLDADGNSQTASMSGKAPAQPGVYEARWRLSDDSDKSWMSLRRSSPPLAQRGATILVLPPASTASDRGHDVSLHWQSVAKIEPAKRPGWDLKQWLPSTGFKYTPRSLSSRGPGLEQAKHDNEAVSILDPKSTYATQLPKLVANLPHRFTVRYPSGQRMRLKVEIATSDRFNDIKRTIFLTDLPTIGTTDPWQTQSFLHYPVSDNEFIRLTNVTDDQLVSFASIQIDNVRDSTVPEQSNPTEALRTVILQLNEFQWIDDLAGDVIAGVGPSFHPEAKAMHKLYVATERLKTYSKLAGYNALMVPGNVGGRCWYQCDAFKPVRKYDPYAADFLQVFLQLMNRDTLRIYVGVDPTIDLADVEAKIRKPASNSASYLRFSGLRVRANQYDLMQDDVGVSLANWVSQLDRQCEVNPCYAGVVISCREGSHTSPIQCDQVLNEPTLRRFASDVDAARSSDSIAALRTWTDGDGRDALQFWCQSQSAKVYRQLAASTHAEILLVDGHLPRSANESDTWTVVADLRRELGAPIHLKEDLDPKGFAAGIVGHASLSDQKIHPAHSPPLLADLTSAVESIDPTVLIVDERKLAGVWCEELAASLRHFAQLPNQTLTDVKGSDPGVKTTQVRCGYHNGKSVLLIANTAPWASEIEVDCHETLNWQSVTADGPTPDNRVTESWSQRDKVIKATLAPGRMLVLTAPTNSHAIPIHAWTSQVSGGEKTMTEINSSVTKVVKRIGSLADPQNYSALSNGGFEQSGGVGIPGWMHTQYPTNAVRIDDSEAVQGRQSVMLTTDSRTAGRTWIVSEQLKPPQSGRLAVSLACRGELVQSDATSHRLRVSIEGTRDSEPIRQTQQFEIPRDGQWQPRRIVLEANGVDPTTVQSIRLTIDSLSPGRVWIDDVHLHDWFPMANERRDLQGEAFMAVQGLQQGNLTPVAQLLQNYWAQYLLNQQDAVVVKPLPVSHPVRRRSEPPNVADRIKSWIPRPLRF
ncbi:MAG: hypothetical protein HKN47_20360 [Pirellulaceae bacterium]|nr:hypothetical protein [Pirellulaceae bacterium]